MCGLGGLQWNELTSFVAQAVALRKPRHRHTKCVEEAPRIEPNGADASKAEMHTEQVPLGRAPRPEGIPLPALQQRTWRTVE
jgi:hypothetical protein